MALARVATASSLAHVSGNKKVGEKKRKKRLFRFAELYFFNAFLVWPKRFVLCGVQLKNLINLDDFHCVYSDVAAH